MEPLLLRPPAAADLLGISRSKMYTMMARGEVPTIRLGGSVRVPVDALKAWIEAQSKRSE